MDKRFLKVLSGEAEGSFVYRDDLVSAFMDIEPINSGHVLVIPNVYSESLKDLDEQTAARMFVVAMKISAAIRSSTLPCDGINLFLADGTAAGQEVFHVHLHVIPRLSNDGFHIQFPDTGEFQSERAELNQVAEEIRSNLKISN